MSVFTEDVKKQLKILLMNVKSRVNILFFTQEFECSSCADTHSFLNEISGLSDKLILTVYDFKKDSKTAEEYGVDKIPAIVIGDSEKKDTGVKFYGIPAGYEINSFIDSMIEASGRKEEYPDDILSRVSAINRDVHIQVFVTLS